MAAMHILKAIAKPVGIILFLVFVVIMGLGIAVTWSTQHGELQTTFLKGKAPAELPDGPYIGTVSGYAGNWRGKEFIRSKKAGLNRFGEGDKLERLYPFALYPAKGLRDTQLDVLKLDYNVSGNPEWLKLVTDEIVEIEPGHFLGKVHLRLVPGYPFALGYFELRKPGNATGTGVTI